jgi:hypothetical protein
VSPIALIAAACDDVILSFNGDPDAAEGTYKAYLVDNHTPTEPTLNGNSLQGDATALLGTVQQAASAGSVTGLQRNRRRSNNQGKDGAAIRSASWRQCPRLPPLPMKDFPDVVPIVVDVAPIVPDAGPIAVGVAPIVPDVARTVVDVAPIVMTVLLAGTETGAAEPVVTDGMEPVAGARGADVPSVVIVTEVTAPVIMLSVEPDVEPPSMTGFDSSRMCRAAI